MSRLGWNVLVTSEIQPNMELCKTMYMFEKLVLQRKIIAEWQTENEAGPSQRRAQQLTLRLSR